VRILFEKGNFVSRHFAKLPKFRAGGVRCTPFHAPAGAFPFEGDAFRNKSIDRVSHVREPGTAPHFSIGHNIQSQLGLFLENLKNRAIFQVAELIEEEAAGSMIRAGFQDFLGAKQTTNMLGAKGFRHGELLPYRMDSGKVSLSFQDERNIIERNCQGQATSFIR
jgi:hypothetical protein